jgi:glycerophosphoryl diester phosphodiesterase
VISDVLHERDGHRTWFKWHRARRVADDAVFSPRRILEGMKEGASVEIDMRRHASGGFVVLHDEQLAEETTGRGSVAAQTPEMLRALRIRGNDGRPTNISVMLFEHIVSLLAAEKIAPEALLQLDFQETAADFSRRDVQSFRDAVMPIRRNVILSAADAQAIALLGEGLDLRIGYDPCFDERLTMLFDRGDFHGFVIAAIASSPDAEIYYLRHELVTAADAAGFDLVGAFHREGKRVDAWTIGSADAATAPIVSRLLDLRVDQITTDDPNGLARMIATFPVTRPTA